MRGHFVRGAFGVSGSGSRLRRLIIRSVTTVTLESNLDKLEV